MGNGFGEIFAPLFFTLFLGVLIASASACRKSEPCPDCDDQANEEPPPDLPVLPDLPCGGADFGFDGDCGPTPSGPDGTMTGSCDEQIPWMTNIETSREVMCCCGE